MKLLKITRTDKVVRFRQEVQGEVVKVQDPDDPKKTISHQGTEERDITCHEVPMESFDAALRALAAVATKALELPPAYAEGVSVYALSLSYTKHGTRSATLYFKKSLAGASVLHPMETPCFQFDDGTKEEGRRQCTPGHAEKIVEMIKQAEKYASGKRQQRLLDFESAPAKKPEDATAPLPFTPEQKGD